MQVCEGHRGKNKVKSQEYYSHDWPRQNFSLQYQYNINQISDENKEKYQFGDNWLIQY